MVEAVAMRTSGLGGDSEVHFIGDGLAGGVTLGPRRHVPVSLIAMDDPDTVMAALTRQINAKLPGEWDGQFLRAVPNIARDGLSPRQIRLLERIGTGVQPAGDVMTSRIDQPDLRRLIDRGLVQLAALTPSDAAHALGWSMRGQPPPPRSR